MKEDWIEVELGEVSQSIQYGYTESSSDKPIGPKFLRITDIQDNNVNWNNVPYCKISEGKIGNYLLKKNDLLFARTGATVGKSFLIRNEIPQSVFASYLIRVRVNNIVLNARYLSYFFNSPFYWQQITDGQVGIGQPNVNGTKLGKLNIPLAPLPIQRAIVLKIENLFAALDKGIADLKTAQEQLKVYRQAVLKKAFEGGFTTTSSKDVASNVSKENNNLPEGWKWVSLKDLKLFSLYGPRFSSKDYSENGIAILRTSDINDAGKVNWNNAPKLNLSDNDYEKYKLIKNDLLITRTGSIGTISVFNDTKKAIPGAFLIHYRLIGDVDIWYIFFYLKSYNAQKHFLENISGIGRPNLNVPNIEKLNIPLPSLSEQHAIVREIESRLSVCDKVEQNIAEALEKAEALRQSILKKAFEGKLLTRAEIEKCKKEKDYEPAAKLLERIRKNNNP